MRFGLFVGVMCGFVALVLPVTFSGNDPTVVDRWTATHVHTSPLGGHPGWLHLLARPSELIVLVPAIVIGAVYFAIRRKWSRVTVVITAPLVAVAVNSWVLKPLYDRHFNGHLVYPSGHTVSLVAVATAFLVVTMSVRIRVAIGAVSVLAMSGAATAMIGLGYHLLTDIVGGIATGIALTLATAATVHRVSWRRGSRRAGG